MLPGDDYMPQQPKIKLYTLSTCAHCKTLREFLTLGNLKYDFVDVDLLLGKERREILKEVKRYNPRCSFPTAVIGERVIVGFKEDELKEVLRLSDEMHDVRTDKFGEKE